jgi:hypothetical protein
MIGMQCRSTHFADNLAFGTLSSPFHLSPSLSSFPPPFPLPPPFSLSLFPLPHPLFSPLILSPLTFYFLGLNGKIEQIPAGFVHRTIMTVGQGLNETFYNWGSILLGYSGKARTLPTADVLIQVCHISCHIKADEPFKIIIGLDFSHL